MVYITYGEGRRKFTGKCDLPVAIRLAILVSRELTMSRTEVEIVDENKIVIAKFCCGITTEVNRDYMGTVACYIGMHEIEIAK